IATPELDLDPLLDANITFHGVLIGDDGDRTRALAALLDRRALRPVRRPELPLPGAAGAHRALERGPASGQHVLDGSRRVPGRRPRRPRPGGRAHPRGR